jgi:PIN domain nuclease of toxin-antitoxin system
VRIVLDSSAFLRFTASEPGGDTVRDLIKEARKEHVTLLISAVNWSEIAAALLKKLSSSEAEMHLESYLQLPIAIMSADEREAHAAAVVRKSYDLGLGDSFAAALALTTKSRLITADFDFKPMARAGALDAEFLPKKSAR